MQASLYNTTFFGVDAGNNSSLPQPQLQPHDISQVDLDLQVLDSPEFASEGFPLRVINTAFDHEQKFNKKLGFLPKNKKNRYRHTQKERSYVEKATKCTSLDDFQEKVCLFFTVEIHFSDILYNRLSLNYPLDQNLIVSNISNCRIKTWKGVFFICILW